MNRARHTSATAERRGYSSGNVQPARSSSGTREIVDYGEIDYRKYWAGEHMKLFNEREFSVVESLLGPEDGWFIDLGCGFGRMVPLYRGAPEKTVLVDYARNNLEIIRDQYPSRPYTLIAADACSLPFDDSVFSRGVSIRLIQNIFTPYELMAELSRVLAPGARFILSYFNRRNLLRILKFGKRCFQRTHVLEHVASYGKMCGTHPAFFRKLCGENGLPVLAHRGAGLVYQLSSHSSMVQELIARSLPFRAAFAAGCAAMDSILGMFDLALWQFCLLEKRPGPPARSGGMFDLVRCPRCRGPVGRKRNGSVLCSRCNASYPFKDGIYDFRIS